MLNLDEKMIIDHEQSNELSKCQKAWLSLGNATRAIRDIKEQDKQLSLVGFLGHFSSGKSSLINRLMGVGPNDSPGFKRATGRHPTDTGITLITHQNSYDQVNRSSITVVESIKVVHGPSIPLLEKIVLVDTPGIGNEQFELEMLLSFLPLCHVIVITIDGRRPFADKEKDFLLLDLALNRLRDVPKIFAITSSEEFLSSRKGDFQTDWDINAAKEFWDQSIERLGKESLFRDKIREIEGIERVYIDSVEGFNIDILQGILLPIVCDPVQRSRTDNARVAYLVSVVMASLEIFDKYLSKRIINLERLYNEAKEKATNAQTAIVEQVDYVRNRIIKSEQELRDYIEKISSAERALGQALDESSHLRKQAEYYLGHLQSLNINLTSERDKLFDSLRQSAIEWFAHEIKNLNRGRSVERLNLSSKCEIYKETILAPLDDLTASKAQEYVKEISKLVEYYLKDASSNLQASMHDDSDSRVVDKFANEVNGSLGGFKKVYGDALKGFVAYVLQPSSKDLLKEHGFTMYDEDGLSAIGTVQFDYHDLDSYMRFLSLIKNKSTNFKVFQEEHRDLVAFDPYESTYSLRPYNLRQKDIVSLYQYCVAEPSLLAQLLMPIENQVNDKADKLFIEIEEQNKKFNEERGSIWSARLSILIRWIIVFVALSAGYLIAQRFVDSLPVILKSIFTVDGVSAIIFGLVGSALFSLLTFMMVGSTNVRISKSINSILLHRMKRRKVMKEIQITFNRRSKEIIEPLKNQLHDHLPDLSHVMNKWAIKYLEQTPEYVAINRELENINNIQRKRLIELNNFKSELHGIVAALPEQLKQLANIVKERSIEQNMTLISNAKDEVKTLDNTIKACIEKCRG